MIHLEAARQAKSFDEGLYLKMLFLDESGDHSLDKIDSSYPMFVLGGVIVERPYVRTVLVPRLRELKEHFFDRDDIILHTADIIRARNGFEALERFSEQMGRPRVGLPSLSRPFPTGQPPTLVRTAVRDTAIRAEFYGELNAMMRELDYNVVACAIRKDEHFARYGIHAADPYMYSLDILVEGFRKELGNVPDSGFICAEKRGLELDRALDRAWAKIIRNGTEFTAGEEIDTRIVDLGLKEKGLDIAGLRLADLVVSPIGRAVLGKPTREDWEIVKSKFLRPGTDYVGVGLVVRP